MSEAVVTCSCGHPLEAIGPMDQDHTKCRHCDEAQPLPHKDRSCPYCRTYAQVER